jgi:sulfate permease
VALLGVAALFAANMGASGMAPAFGAALGAKVLRRRHAVALFAICVMVGAVCFGSGVAETMGRGLVPASHLDGATTLCALSAATVALLGANWLRVPPSTSWVAVGAVTAVGLARGALDVDVLLWRLLPAWLLLPLAAFAITLLVMGRIYPLRARSMRFHEALPRHERTLKIVAVVSSCYVALAIGANNVANAVGPLSATGVVDVTAGMWLLSPCLAAGALWPGPAETVGKGIVPVGLLSACVVNMVVGTLLLSASLVGIPQSLVHLSTASVLGVSRVKEGAFALMDDKAIRRIGLVWLLSPLFATLLSWITPCYRRERRDICRKSEPRAKFLHANVAQSRSSQRAT